MNLKKSFLVAIAGATAVAMTGVVASAADLGQSDDIFFVEAGKATEGTVLLNNSVAISFTIGADVLEVGTTTVVFNATQIADDEKKYEDAIKATGVAEVFDYTVMDLSFENVDGEDLGLTNITLSIENGDFNAVYVEEDGKLTKLELKDGSFVAPHFSNYVFAKVSEGTEQPSEPVTPSEPAEPGVTTGDNAMTTMLVFAGVAAVSLGTVVVASKARKSK